MKSMVFFAIIANTLVFGQETGRTLGLPSFFSNGNGQPELTFMRLDNLPNNQQGFSISNNRYTPPGPMEWTEEQKEIVRSQEEFRKSVAEANKNRANLRQEIIHPEEMVVQQLPESIFNHNNFNSQNVPELEKFRPSQPFDENVFTRRPPPPPPAFMPLKTEGENFRQNFGQNVQFQSFTPETPTFTQLTTPSQRVETFIQPQTEKPRLVLRVNPISNFKNPELSTFIRTDTDNNFGQRTLKSRQRQNFNFQNQGSQTFQEPVKDFNHFQTPQENHNVQVPVRQGSNFQSFQPEENVQFVQNQPLVNTFRSVVNNQNQDLNVPVFNEQPESFPRGNRNQNQDLNVQFNEQPVTLSPLRRRPATLRSRTQPTLDLTTPLPDGSLAEDEINRKMAESAKYSFQSAVADSINDNTHIRQETRDGLSLKGLYSYSDGYFKRTVHYVADENGYRVIKEESEPIGTGPVLNPTGQVDVSTSLSGSSLQYTLKGENLPKRKTTSQKFREETN